MNKKANFNENKALIVTLSDSVFDWRVHNYEIYH